MSVFSDDWPRHLQHIDRYLQVIKNSGLTLNLKKCHFAQSEIKFVGQIIGSNKRRPAPDKVAPVKDTKAPETKKQVRQVIVLFLYFRDFIPNFAELAKPLTDLTGKRVPSHVPSGSEHNKAFETLKNHLRIAAEKSLQIVDFNKPWNLQVDSGDYAISGVLTQPTNEGTEMPVAFLSHKLTETQRNWSVVEKEAYAAIWSLARFRNWIFGKPVTL